MKKGCEIEIDITGIRYPNDTYGYIDEKKVYVKDTIPGQRVLARIRKNRKNQAEARLLEVLARAKEELPASCPHNDKCGGCVWNTLPYERQLQLKQQAVKALFDKSEIPYEAFEEIIPSPIQTGYRNKMEFSFGDEVKDGEITLGMHKRGFYRSVITVDQCTLCNRDFTKILETTLQYVKENQLPKKDKISHEGILRHLLIRRGQKTGEILVALVTQSTNHDFTPWKERLLQLKLEGTIVGIHHIFNDSKGDAVLCDRMETLYGRAYFYDEILGLRFKITPFSFFQTNTLGAEVLYQTGLNFIHALDSKIVYDLYSGTGTIGQIAAARAKQVYAIEIVEEAVCAANENAKANGIKNFTSIAGDVFTMLDSLPERPEVIILDPPRSGVAPKAMDKILDYGVNEILYISCNPKTLVENLKQAIEKGYAVKIVRCVDMFPCTAHVETVALLTKKGYETGGLRDFKEEMGVRFEGN